MRAVDTNLLVRIIARDDPAQAEAAEKFISHGAWISHLVLAEAVWVLESVYDLDEPRLTKAVEMLLNHERLTIQDADVVASALEAFRNRPSPGFTDCLILETARRAGHLPLGTFDRTLGRLPGAERLKHG
jgi:predicted nucleic-acid-binding protein